MPGATTTESPVFWKEAQWPVERDIATEVGREEGRGRKTGVLLLWSHFFRARAAVPTLGVPYGMVWWFLVPETPHNR